MSSLSTKILVWSAGLIGFLLVAPFVLPKLIPFLFAVFSSNRTVFISVDIHTAPFFTCVVIWVAAVICARISFQHDRRRSSGQ